MSPSNNPKDEVLLTERDASLFLAISNRTLQTWRSKGLGPPFVRVGRAIRYQRQALIDWTNSRTVCPAKGRP